MLKPIRLLALALVCLCSTTHAAGPGAETMRALQTIVTAQDIEEKYRAYLDSSAARHAATLQKMLEEKLNAQPTLSQAQRKRALAMLPAWSAALAADLKIRDKSMNLPALISDMAQTIYPRYFTDAELKELAAFYASSAYQKTIDVSARIKENERRTGLADPAAWDNYEHLFTEAENEVILANGESALGKKLARVTSALNREILMYLGAKTSSNIEAIAARHMAEFVATVNADTSR
ncbi:DUF2059 domain-containing protein [Massilia violaceinigra]|uniref:DUF2059 domain-containing protein n=1 Tax=Massilia violaceinigra TaxID=2045208 RepID=A0ABY4A595_9BURK|nr:DUF2059 domain-containing protein [Massilia violaceinigra]UOD29927.1 DUF2059 domain-containing protein [Massilia violaceinigra]